MKHATDTRLDRAVAAMINAQACPAHRHMYGGYAIYATSSTLATCPPCARLALLAALRVVLAEPSVETAAAVGSARRACAAFAAELAALEQEARR